MRLNRPIPLQLNQKSSKDARDACERLRRWRRHQLRALELKVSLPDATLLIRSITKTVDPVLLQSPQAAFRINSFRMTNKLDTQPTDESVLSYYTLLLSEMELLSLSPEEVGGATAPAVKMMNSTTKPGASPSGATLTCRAWGAEGGCRFGRDCKFTHDWAGLDDKSSRCWICSGVGHEKAACPFRRTEGGASGGSGSPGVVETSSKHGKGQK